MGPEEGEARNRTGSRAHAVQAPSGVRIKAEDDANATTGRSSGGQLERQNKG